jgi:hypothetical protein
MLPVFFCSERRGHLRAVASLHGKEGVCSGRDWAPAPRPKQASHRVAGGRPALTEAIASADPAIKRSGGPD